MLRSFYTLWLNVKKFDPGMDDTSYYYLFSVSYILGLRGKGRRGEERGGERDEGEVVNPWEHTLFPRSEPVNT